ncbi:hypothetical protein B0T10DRAFT_462105 [Thelonectria olida]|uniref:Uncharacterized protein n=1 Tax=Thelonectria olida TaxID=1576542 RepID=A0A9P8VZU1_9HYPO|nr:hypothetical protein B0T10DRAFT_462105 [Thelonectria olida]
MPNYTTAASYKYSASGFPQLPTGATSDATALGTTLGTAIPFLYPLPSIAFVVPTLAAALECPPHPSHVDHAQQQRCGRTMLLRTSYAHYQANQPTTSMPMPMSTLSPWPYLFLPLMFAQLALPDFTFPSFLHTLHYPANLTQARAVKPAATTLDLSMLRRGLATACNIEPVRRLLPAPPSPSIFTSSSPGPGLILQRSPALTLLIPVNLIKAQNPLSSSISPAASPQLNSRHSSWLASNRLNRPSSTAS